MINSLIKHLVQLTEHRDHGLLDFSVISAFDKVIGAKQARVLELYQHQSELYVRARVWLENGKVIALDEKSQESQAGSSVLAFPLLVECISQQLSRLENITDDGDYIIIVPIWQNEKVATCIEITSARPYSTNTLEVIEGILSVYRNFQSLLDYSERDSLTGLLNRKTFDERFSKLTLSRTASPINPPLVDERRVPIEEKSQWLAVVDIDHFKRVNDKFGHLYGDEVLVLIANLLRSSFRSHDGVFRFGGEEFVVLLQSTTLTDVHKVFERFRANVQNFDFPKVGHITVSLGFTEVSRDAAITIIGRADKAMYYAKENGRNRICLYENLVNSGAMEPEAVVSSINNED